MTFSRLGLGLSDMLQLWCHGEPGRLGGKCAKHNGHCEPLSTCKESWHVLFWAFDTVMRPCSAQKTISGHSGFGHIFVRVCLQVVFARIQHALRDGQRPRFLPWDRRDCRLDDFGCVLAHDTLRVRVLRVSLVFVLACGFREAKKALSFLETARFIRAYTPKSLS